MSPFAPSPPPVSGSAPDVRAKTSAAAPSALGDARGFVFEDPRTRAVIEQVRRVARSNATVLVTGETGTGKEIVARHLHDCSRRSERPFVAVNCGALAEQLVESELFGHEKGAFTGAAGPKAGWFETAHGGTLFLDEVGDLSLPMQVKLLRVIQEAEVVRLGSRRAIPIDVRLVAATNVNLEEAMATGRFREDLYYRLGVAEIRLPPLRERPGDIIPLAEHFLATYGRRLGTSPRALHRSARERLVGYAWPGNIRELENVIHRALLVAEGDSIEAGDLQLAAPRAKSTPPPSAEIGGIDLLRGALSQLFEQPGPHLNERIEKAIIEEAFRFSGQNQQRTGRLLGISRNIVRARLIDAGEIEGQKRRPKVAGTRLRIGYHRFGLLTVIKALGSFEAAMQKQGVDVEWLQFPAGPEVAGALQSGEVSLGVVGDGPSVIAQATDAPFLYWGAEAKAPEAAAIVVHARSDIRTVADLAGRSIAVKRGSNVHYLLIRALEEAGVAYGDVSVTYAAPESARAAFEQRRVDAWGIWDPLLAGVQQSTGARVLRNGVGLTENAAYYLAHREFAHDHPAVLEELLEHAQDAAQRARQSTEEVAHLVAEELLLPIDATARWLRRHPSMRPLSRDLVDSQQQVADALHRVQVLPRPVRVADARWHRLAG